MLTAIHTIYPSIHNAAPAKCSIILSFLEVEKKKKKWLPQRSAIAVWEKCLQQAFNKQ